MERTDEEKKGVLYRPLSQLQSRFLQRRRKQAGAPPGDLTYVGEERSDPVTVEVVDFNEDMYDAFTADNVADSFGHRGDETVTWIDVNGLHDTEIVDAIGEEYDVHPLLREDILNTDQRPKFDDMEDYLFVQLKMLRYDEQSGATVAEQVSFLLGAHVLISFQETAEDVFDPVRDRLRNGKGQIRKRGADYLLYALIDAVVDNYFIVLEQIGERLEDVEDELLYNPDPATLQEVHGMKRELIFLRKAVWPLREVISRLERSESPLIAESTGVYFRDVYEHTIQVIDIIETFRDMVSSALDIYLSSVSNRMNEVMKVLTIIATIFIPLTFIAGVYGMNFDPAASPFNMPELGWYWGYPAVMALMLVIALGELYYFRRKDWI